MTIRVTVTFDLPELCAVKSVNFNDERGLHLCIWVNFKGGAMQAFISPHHDPERDRCLDAHES